MANNVSMKFLWRHFSSNGTYYKNDRSHKNAWCNYCIEGVIHIIKESNAARVRDGRPVEHEYQTEKELEDLARQRVHPVCSKAERMVPHIKKCTYISSDDRTLILLSWGIGASRAPSRISLPSPPAISHSPGNHNAIAVLRKSPLNPRPLKMSKSFHGASGGGIRALIPGSSIPEQQEWLSGRLCRLFIAMNIPWSGADCPSLHAFFRDLLGPEVIVQDRRVLSGRVLDKEVQKVEATVIDKVRGKMATGQCDGWKNVAKSSVVSTLMTVENESYLVQTHDVTREPKTGEQLLKHVLDDKKLMAEKFGVEVIGWCTDDGPDGKKMRRLLQTLFSYLIVILCWAHQINLVVGDCLAIRRGITDDINCALEVIKWFNNHSAALALLQVEQTLTFEGSFWALILPAITRWTAHYLSITRYLKLKQPLQLCWVRNEDKLVTCAGPKQDLQEKARYIQSLVRDECLWVRLQKIQKFLEPLAIAANVAQASHTRLDHVLLVLGNLTRIFTQNTEFEDDIREGVIKSLEKRWKKADQDVFIAAVFLNPFIRASLFNKGAINEAELHLILDRVYQRVMRRKPDLEFLRAFEDYRLKLAEFSDERMGLELMKRRFVDEDAPIDLRLIWARLDRDVDHGRNALVKLAIRIFTVIANSAGCERVFSKFGNTHTKRRNKLLPKKVHAMTVVGMQIKREDRELGLVQRDDWDDPWYKATGQEMVISPFTTLKSTGSAGTETRN